MLNTNKDSTKNANSSNWIEALKEFLQKHRILLLIMLIMLTLSSVGLIAYNIVQSEYSKNASIALEKIIEYSDLVGKAEEADKEIKLQEFRVLVKNINKDFPNSYQSQKSLIIQGNTLFDQKLYDQAIISFEEAFALNKSKVLSAVALFNIANSYEILQDKEKALEYLNRLVNEFHITSPEIPRAIINIARIQESNKDLGSARSNYQKIIDSWAESEWIKIAKDRLVYLDKKEIPTNPISE